MITAREYINEVKIRLLRNNVNSEFDDMTILTQINRSRRNIALLTVDIFPDFYIKNHIIPVGSPFGGNFDPNYSTQIYGGGNLIIHRYPINVGDFIKPLEVWLRFVETNTNITRVWQVRIVSRKEFHNTIKHSMNAPLPSSMVCYFEQSITDGGITMVIGYEANTFVNYIYNLNGCDLILYFFALPNDLELYTDVSPGNFVIPDLYSSDTEIDIPPHLQELVILQAILYLLMSQKYQTVYQKFKDEFAIVWSMLISNKEIEKYQKETLLPSKKPLEGVNFPINLLNLQNEGGE